MSDLTPMMRQHQELKKQYPDAILLFRLGDFYEMFGADAELAAPLLQIALTSRDAGHGRKMPMAGVPYHAVENYLAKLIRAGHKVAICDQMEDPKLTKGLVRRDVTRLITPGTVIEGNLLEDKSNNYLIAVNLDEKSTGLAVVDVSTGHFSVTEWNGQRFDKLFSELSRLKPRECLMPESLFSDAGFVRQVKSIAGMSIESKDDWQFSADAGTEVLVKHFGVQSLAGFGCEDLKLAIGAAGVLILYLKDTQKASLGHITRLNTYSLDDFMRLDPASQRNLDLVQRSFDGSSEGTLVSVLDMTVTPMGGRLLRSWVLQPLLNVEKIRYRQTGVAEMAAQTRIRQELREIMGKIQDLERLSGRLGCGRVNARDMIALKNSLSCLPLLKEKLQKTSSEILRDLNNRIDILPGAKELLEKSIADDPPLALKDGGLIKQSFNEELDELKESCRGGKEWIAGLQQKERERTGISSLKVGFTSVFGYYIEVTKSNLSQVPPDYVRRQTVAAGERFITPELKEYEAKVLGAEEKINELEFQLFLQVRDEICKFLPALRQDAESLSQVDVLCSFAEAAVKYRYARPEVNSGDTISIVEGRHPVIERYISRFVPNDTKLDQAEQMLMITGPNMAGKSTYLRQVALITLMSQIGSFVPAKEAEMGLVDRIFTRVGASDNLIAGQSTFMVEMNETANIINNATKRSLIILDEIGRGTSTFDGVSIAWAVAEHIYRLGTKTLFATHYFELIELAEEFSGIKNYNIAVKEWNEKIIFLYKIMPGAADRSYGIQVARLAGLPTDLLKRAKEILTRLEAQAVDLKNSPENQMELFNSRPAVNPTEEELKKIDVDNLTPLQALNKLKEIQEKINNQGLGRGI